MDAPAQAEDHSALIHDEEIWFPDGNVVLVAQGRAFKVYQGLLSRDSEVFRDLFAVPQPSSVEALDGCPIVHLTDSHEELRHVLRVIFDGKRHYQPGEQLEFAVVAALVRLSHKYQLDYVRDDFLGRMKSCFGTDLGVWERVSYKHGSSAMKILRHRCHRCRQYRTANRGRLDVARCLISLLPTRRGVLYQRLSSYLGRHCRISSPEDTATCINARQSLLRQGLLDATDIFDSSVICHGDDKSNDDGCRSSIDSLRQGRLAKGVDVLVGLFSGAKSNLSLISTRESQGLLCRACADALRGAEQEVYKRHWDNLPRLLSIDVPTDWPRSRYSILWDM